VRTERLELRLPHEEEISVLMRVAEAGVHPPEEMPFEFAWTDGIGRPGFAEAFPAYHRGLRTGWTAESWALELGVFAAGEPMGCQGLRGERFASTHRAVTGSWLGERYQGRGYGTEMRAAVLELAFAGLGAEVAVSGYADGNLQSRRVSEKLGYAPAGEAFVEPRGHPIRHLMLELTRERWAATERIPVVIEGLEPCLALFGATA
jgi:RimJ/RimL family protein N-acetyltransferase